MNARIDALRKKVTRIEGKECWNAFVHAVQFNTMTIRVRAFKSQHEYMRRVKIVLRSLVTRKQRIRYMRPQRRNQCPLAWAA